ncbi:hypothetical protein U1Q18_038175 [Sarracenia purpurea var. burkii]
MEANRKRQEFSKRNPVMPLWRAAKGGGSPSISPAARFRGKTKASPSDSAASSVAIIINRDYATPQPNHTVSITPQVPEKGARDAYPKFETLYRGGNHATPQPNLTTAPFAPSAPDTYTMMETRYGGVAADESVDLDAASYISRVRERFSRESSSQAFN